VLQCVVSCFLALLTNIKLGWKRLLGTNSLAYLAHSKVTKKKSVANIATEFWEDLLIGATTNLDESWRRRRRRRRRRCRRKCFGAAAAAVIPSRFRLRRDVLWSLQVQWVAGRGENDPVVSTLLHRLRKRRLNAFWRVDDHSRRNMYSYISQDHKPNACGGKKSDDAKR
jgi:hypothetical protein